MEETSLSNDLSNYIKKNFQLATNKAGNIRVSDFTLAGNGLPKRFFKTFLADRKKYKEIHEPLRDMADSEIIDELSNTLPSLKEDLSDYLLGLELSKVSEESGLHISKDAYFNVIPVIDMEDIKGRAIMVDKDSGRVSTLQEKSWERVVGAKHVAHVRELGYCGRFEFNPRTTEAFLSRGTVHGDEIIYNKFIPPAYRLKRDRKVKLDPIFIDFLDGLFTEGCRSYAYNWLYHSCFRRVPIYLVLVGAGGIGKNLLAEALSFIHGKSNFTKAPSSALDTKFNGHLVDNTMLYYDECKFSAGKEGATTRKNRLKEWANDYVPIEIKGVDAINKDIFCSAIIATNNDSDVHLEQLDRKFSVMELSEERLEKRMGLKNTQFLWEYIKKPEFADAFINWLEDRIDTDFNPHVEYKGPKFDELVLSSLYSWQQDLLFNHIVDTHSKHLDVKNLRENISLFPKHTSKIDDFLKNFTWKGHKLGKVVTIDGKAKIKINEELLPPKLETHSIDSLE